MHASPRTLVLAVALTLALPARGGPAGPTDGPDLDALEEISLPLLATRENVARYVRRVLAASVDQRRYLPTDPQVGSLVKVGHRFLPELLAEARSGNPSSLYVVEAVGALAEDGDRAAVLARLAECPELVKVVVRKGWTVDAREVLVETLRTSSRYLPIEWIRAVVAFRDPSTHDALVAYLLHGWNRHSTYEELRHVPGLELSRPLVEAWENARAEGERYEVGYLLPHVLAAGHVPALELAAERLGDNAGMPRGAVDVRALLERYTDARGADADLRRWVEERRGRLRFDPARRKFAAGRP